MLHDTLHSNRDMWGAAPSPSYRSMIRYNMVAACALVVSSQGRDEDVSCMNHWTRRGGKGQPRTLLVESGDLPHGSLTQAPNVGGITHLCIIVNIITIHRICM